MWIQRSYWNVWHLSSLTHALNNLTGKTNISNCSARYLMKKPISENCKILLAQSLSNINQVRCCLNLPGSNCNGLEVQIHPIQADEKCTTLRIDLDWSPSFSSSGLSPLLLCRNLWKFHWLPLLQNLAGNETLSTAWDYMIIMLIKCQRTKTKTKSHSSRVRHETRTKFTIDLVTFARVTSHKLLKGQSQPKQTWEEFGLKNGGLRLRLCTGFDILLAKQNSMLQHCRDETCPQPISVTKTDNLHLNDILGTKWNK